MKDKFSINVLFIKEKEKWSAQGLEYDITGQGETPIEALKSFEHMVVGHIILDIENGRKALSNIPKAPQLYWTLGKRSEGLVNSEPEPIFVPDPNIDVSRKIFAFT